jgi:hypothetical protein
MKVLTTVLNDGTKVLGKGSKSIYAHAYEIDAMTFINYSQANKKIDALKSAGTDCYLIDRGRVKFVGIK